MFSMLWLCRIHQVELPLTQGLPRQRSQCDTEKANSLTLRSRLDVIGRGNNDFYVDDILPAFDTLKTRQFDPLRTGLNMILY